MYIILYLNITYIVYTFVILCRYGGWIRPKRNPMKHPKKHTFTFQLHSFTFSLRSQANGIMTYLRICREKSLLGKDVFSRVNPVVVCDEPLNKSEKTTLTGLQQPKKGETCVFPHIIHGSGQVTVTS